MRKKYSFWLLITFYANWNHCGVERWGWIGEENVWWVGGGKLKGIMLGTLAGAPERKMRGITEELVAVGTKCEIFVVWLSATNMSWHQRVRNSCDKVGTMSLTVVVRVGGGKGNEEVYFWRRQRNDTFYISSNLKLLKELNCC